MAARPLVTVYNEKYEATESQLKLPAVFEAPIRPDIVSFIHDQVRRNKRQAHAVAELAGSFIIFYVLHYLVLFFMCYFQASSILLNHGEQDVPSPVFLVCVVAVPTVPDRELLETCAVEDTCSLP